MPVLTSAGADKHTEMSGKAEPHTIDDDLEPAGLRRSLAHRVQQRRDRQSWCSRLCASNVPIARSLAANSFSICSSIAFHRFSVRLSMASCSARINSAKVRR